MILCQNDKQIINIDNIDSFSGCCGGTHVSHEIKNYPIPLYCLIPRGSTTRIKNPYGGGKFHPS